MLMCVASELKKFQMLFEQNVASNVTEKLGFLKSTLKIENMYEHYR